MTPYLKNKMKCLGVIDNKKKLESVIGILSFAQTHVRHLETLIEPLRKQLLFAKKEKQSKEWWHNVQRNIANIFEKILANAVDLHLLKNQYQKFEIYTDWSDKRSEYILFGIFLIKDYINT